MYVMYTVAMSMDRVYYYKRCQIQTRYRFKIVWNATNAGLLLPGWPGREVWPSHAPRDSGHNLPDGS